MQVLIVGTGKLATELLTSLRVDPPCQVVSWATRVPTQDKSIVVHAGSGRELKEVIACCHETHSTLVELATGSEIEAAQPDFPVVVCPNTNILMLKFMSMLAKSGHLFAGYRIKLAESHQAHKTSTPGTAVSIAHALGLKANDVLSVRDPEEQRTALQIPIEHLDRHAFHRILIEDALCSVTMETRVYGASRMQTVWPESFLQSAPTSLRIASTNSMSSSKMAGSELVLRRDLPGACDA